MGRHWLSRTRIYNLTGLLPSRSTSSFRVPVVSSWKQNFTNTIRTFRQWKKDESCMTWLFSKVPMSRHIVRFFNPCSLLRKAECVAVLCMRKWTASRWWTGRTRGWIWLWNTTPDRLCPLRSCCWTICTSSPDGRNTLHKLTSPGDLVSVNHTRYNSLIMKLKLIALWLPLEPKEKSQFYSIIVMKSWN